MIYLDNAATTYPKPRSVIEAVKSGIEKYGANPGRSSFKMAIAASEKVYECRQAAADLFNADGAENVVFTLNCTHAVNMALKGILKRGDHVITSSLEHNAVMRPLMKLKKCGITHSIARVYPQDNEKTVENFRKLIQPNTKMIICMHASNVFGIRLPIERIGELCRQKHLIFVVDAAQSAGVLPIDMKNMNISVLCLPGHKGLYGPAGTGMLIVNGSIKLDTIIEGGTGNNSAQFVQPDDLPERLESGTINLPGIMGLKAGMDFVKEKTTNRILFHEMVLMQRCYDQLSSNPNIELYMPKPTKNYFVPLISFNIKGKDCFETADLLSEKDIATRAGLHCSPAAHKCFNTFESGTVRICPSAFSTNQDIDYFINCINNISK